jgi:hypothetical protein
MPLAGEDVSFNRKPKACAAEHDQPAIIAHAFGLRLNEDVPFSTQGMLQHNLRDYLIQPSFTATSSIPLPLPRLREYFFSCGLFQCSWTPRLASRAVAVAWFGS